MAFGELVEESVKKALKQRFSTDETRQWCQALEKLEVHKVDSLLAFSAAFETSSKIPDEEVDRLLDAVRGQWDGLPETNDDLRKKTRAILSDIKTRRKWAHSPSSSPANIRAVP